MQKKTVIALADSRAPLAIPPAAPLGAHALADSRGRGLHDLRISVTDRCNFRCTYCMPREVFDANYSFLPHEEISRSRKSCAWRERSARSARRRSASRAENRSCAATSTGWSRCCARRCPSIDLTLTTNGSALKAHAKALRAAGLDRVTVSLDSLDEGTFRAMNDADFPVAKVLEGIDEAAAAGLGPIKVNMVVKRGVNDHQVVDMARHFPRQRPHRALHRIHGRGFHQRLAHG
jgi:cyclic pyranopterin phosphate synthase